MTRMLRVLAHVRNAEEQELIRKLLEGPLETAYERARTGTDLPSRSGLALMTDREFDRFVKRLGAPVAPQPEPAARKGVGRLVPRAAA